MIVVKFGGSSLADAERIQAAAHIVARHRRGFRSARGSEESAHEQVICVVSALGGVTDELFSIASLARQGDERWRIRLTALRDRHLRVLAHLTGRTDFAPSYFVTLWSTLEADLAHLIARFPVDAINAPNTHEQEQEVNVFSAWGERLAVALFATALANEDIAAVPFEREPVIAPTPGPSPVRGREESKGWRELSFGRGRGEIGIASVEATRAWLLPRLATQLEEGAVPVLPGYLARTAAGTVTTLGRNGSDYSAAVIGAALGAEAVYLYSDVAGVHQADPLVISDAALLPDLTYADVATIASLGARVVHPATLAPLAKAHIPLYLRSALAPDAPGTDVDSSIRRDLTPTCGHPSPRGEGTVGHADRRSDSMLSSTDDIARPAAPLPRGEEGGGEVSWVIVARLLAEKQLAEVTVVLLTHADWREETPTTDQQEAIINESHPMLVKAALALLNSETAPLELSLSAERLRVTVPADAAVATQRRLYAAMAASDMRERPADESAPTRLAATKPACAG